MNIRESAAQIISSVLETAYPSVNLSIPEILALLEDPKDKNLGDIAFPCFRFAKELKQAPPKIAAEMVVALVEGVDQSESLERVQATGPYINFFIDKAFLAKGLIEAIQSGDFLKRRPQQSDKVMVEYSQPNTHKAFHVGHSRNAALGDSIRRIFEWSGHETVAVSYIGDEGTHVARCLWYLDNHFRGSIPDTNRGEFLGTLYVEATKLLDLGTRTSAPTIGVVAAQVTAVAPHPTQADWDVLTLETSAGRKTVVSRMKSIEVGSMVPYAAPGVKVAGKVLESVQKKGVLSEGMVCSEQEIGFSENNEFPPALPANAQLGDEVADLYSLSGQPVVAEFLSQLEEVSTYLQAIESGTGPIWELWKKTKQWSMDDLDVNHEWLACHFDHIFFESECGESSKRLVDEFYKKGTFVDSDGAIGANLRDYGLGFCLLLKRDGTVLYATRDLSLAQVKFDTYGIDRSIYVVDSAQTLHFQQVFKCLELMGYEQAHKCYHLPYAQVVLPSGKMSSRKGNVILFSELKERLLSKIRSEYLSKYENEWPQEELDQTAYAIALATIRYGMLNQDNNSLIVFDLEEWTAKTGNTGPYILYAYARIASILKEAGAPQCNTANFSLLTHPTEAEVLLHLMNYHGIVERACQQMTPMLLCVYVYQLSKLFSQMYSQCSVLKAESEELSIARVCLVDSIAKVIKHALSLIGIVTVERM